MNKIDVVKHEDRSTSLLINDAPVSGFANLKISMATPSIVKQLAEYHGIDIKTEIPKILLAEVKLINGLSKEEQLTAATLLSESLLAEISDV